ncbi:MAG: MoaD/ThiS family protein [gamma proteobacterium symbiont of Taylorina sp.]|nr:MoaD/ThiS family protein [gamma proteobacterium symbiont of Taylorina sp.]
MKISIQCFAGLKKYLPDDALNNLASLVVDEGINIEKLLKLLSIDDEEAHLVILNGIFIPSEERSATHLKENDSLTLWPEVAGG